MSIDVIYRVTLENGHVLEFETRPDAEAAEIAYDNVQRGVALLDEKLPGWYDKIAVCKLRMENAQDCIVGQLFVPQIRAGLDPYGAGLAALEIQRGREY